MARRRNWFSFSLRTLLIAMTLFGVAIVWWQRSARFAERANYHAAKADDLADVAWGIQRFNGFSEEANKEAEPYWREYAAHDERAKQYRRAAWLGFVAGPRE